MTAPSQIMQRRFRRIAQFQPYAVSNQSVKTGTFIHFVKVRQRFSGKQFLPVELVMNRRPIDVIKQARDEIGGGGESLQPLLILDSDRRTAKPNRAPDSSDIHFALLKHLILGQIGFFARSEMEFHTTKKKPIVYSPGFFIWYCQHFCVQARLTQSLFINPSRMQQLVGNNRVVHTHTTFVEDSHDRFSGKKSASNSFSHFARGSRT